MYNSNLSAAPPSHILLDEHAIALRVIRHPRARRVSVRLSTGKDSLIVTLPPRASLQKALAFVQSQKDWVLQHAHLHTTRDSCPASLPVFDIIFQVILQSGRGLTHIHQDRQEIHLYGDSAFAIRRLRQCLDRHLYNHLEARIASLAAMLAVKPRQFSLRDMRARWGSCNSQHEILLNRRLVYAPLWVVDYVITHELAHIKEMNHSSRFWRHVQHCHPNFKSAQHWLRTHGHTLYHLP